MPNALLHMLSKSGRSIVVLLALLLSPITCIGAFAQSPAPTGSTIVPSTDKSLLYIGRWDLSNPARPHSHWEGANIRTRFTGTSVGILMGQGNWMLASIDGEPPRFVDGQNGYTPLNIYPLSPGLHTLLVGPSCGGEVLFNGLVLDAGARVLPAIPRPIIEYIGDSITWGTGPDKMYTVNWAWNTAEALNCDHSQVAQSGRALTTGYGCAQPLIGLDTQYFKLKNFGYIDPPDWDFSQYKPAMIVINLGQNDACGNEPDTTFIPSYEKFISNIRAKFPVAQIVCIRMFGGGHFGDDTRQAVAAVNAAGDARVHFIDTAGWLGPGDFVDGIHPNALGNVVVAEHLTPLLRQYLPARLISLPPDTATVGNPHNPSALPEEIQNAYLRGERRITVTPGYYLFPSTNAPHLPLNYWHDEVLSAYNCTFMLQNPTNSDKLFTLNHCENTVIEGCVTSQTTQTAYQGPIVDTGENQGSEYVDWQPSAGYPVPSATTTTLWIDIVDGKTHMLKEGVGDYYNAQLTPLANGVYRIQFNTPTLRFGVGDIVVARYGDPPQKFGMDTNTNCTLKDIVMMRNGFAPIFEGGGGGDHFVRVHWELGPRPAGATENPVVTNAADGIHAAGCDPGPDIEDCTFEGVFLDDCIAIHGNYQGVTAVNGRTLTVKDGYANLRIGEPARISNASGFFLQANVTALKENGDGTSTVTVDTTQTIPVGAKMSNPLRDGQGYKIIGCRLGDTRSRGIICKADDGLIEGNTIAHCSQAISIGPEYGENEADYCQDVTIQGNTIEDDGFNGDNVMYVHGEGVMENRNITIQNNKFVGNFGTDIHLDSVTGATVTQNVFTAPLLWPSWDALHPVLDTSSTSGAAITQNIVATQAGFAKPLCILATTSLR